MGDCEKTLLVFDLNGVVLRLSPWRVVCALWNCPRKVSLVYLAFNPLFIRDLMCGIYRKQVLEHLIEQLAVKYHHFAAIQDTALQVISAQKTRPGMKHVLEQLQQKHYQLAVLTNIGARSLAIIGAQQPELIAYFTFVMCPIAHEQYRAKPDPAVFVAFKQCVCPAVQKIIFIDDRSNNIKQAQKAGMIAVQFKGVHRLMNQLKDLAIL